MKNKKSKLLIHSFLFCFLASSALLQGAEKRLRPSIDSVSTFKNGLTVVKASFNMDEPGDYHWFDPPQAVHGAFFVESDPGLVVRSTTVLAERDGVYPPTGDFQSDLAGAVVVVSLTGTKDNKPDEIRGRVWRVPSVLPSLNWNTNYSTTNGHSYFYSGGMNAQPNRHNLANWLVLEIEGSLCYVARHRIHKIQIEQEAEEKPQAPQPVMVFSSPAGGRVELTYITKGMAWMPAYQIDLLSDERLALKQSAVIRNELMDFDETEVFLISGYPNIKFAHVDSPLNVGANLASFFQQISQRGGNHTGALTQQIAYNSVASRASEAVMPLSQSETGAPAKDLHYESIGKHSLREGDSLSLEVASAEAACERIVEWWVPDYRDDRGHLRRHYERGEDEEPWDAIQFKNPLSFPMTTAAASVLEQGRFIGQSMATWVAPGQQVCIKINKALTVHGEHFEIEEERNREVIQIGGRKYRVATVKGQFEVSNTRAEPVKMRVRIDFSGELIEAEGHPVKTLRTEGVRSVNPQSKLEWMLDLAPAASKTVEYRYSVLVAT